VLIMNRLAATTILASCLIVLGGCGVKPTVQKTVPPGTALEVELLDGLSSASNTQGDAVSARVAQDVTVSGKVVIPAGSTVSGTITEARGLKAIGGRALLSVRFDSVDLPTGEAPIQAAFSRQGKSETKKDAATIGGAAAGGALLGRMLDHNHPGNGTVTGLIVGGAAGTAIAAGTKGEEVVLPAGTRLAVHLLFPVTVKVEA
jgi:hypothetical protein